jgi:hypothetical protein
VIYALQMTIGVIVSDAAPAREFVVAGKVAARVG